MLQAKSFVSTGVRYGPILRNRWTRFWATSHLRIQLRSEWFQTLEQVSYHHSTPLLQRQCEHRLPKLWFLRILILGCDRDVDDDEDAGVDAVVQNPCHSLDRQLFEDEFYLIWSKVGMSLYTSKKSSLQNAWVGSLITKNWWSSRWEDYKKLMVFSLSAFEGSRVSTTLKPCLGTADITSSTSTMNHMLSYDEHPQWTTYGSH